MSLRPLIARPAAHVASEARDDVLGLPDIDWEIGDRIANRVDHEGRSLEANHGFGAGCAEDTAGIDEGRHLGSPLQGCMNTLPSLSLPFEPPDGLFPSSSRTGSPRLTVFAAVVPPFDRTLRLRRLSSNELAGRAHSERGMGMDFVVVLDPSGDLPERGCGVRQRVHANIVAFEGLHEGLKQG